MKRILGWLAAALAAIVVGLLWLSSTREERPVARTVAEHLADGAAELTGGIDARGAPGSNAVDARRALDALPAAPSAPRSDPAKPPIGAWTVRAVYASDGAPAPGAEIDVLTWNIVDGLHGLEAARRAPTPDPNVRPLEWEDVFASHAFETRVADEAGHVVLRRANSGLSVRARAVRNGVEHRGEADWVPYHDAAGLLVELRPLRSVEVRVVDGTGAPVEGLPIAVLSRSLGADLAQIVSVARTDRSGRARLDDAGLSELHAQYRAELVVRAIAVLDPPLEAPFDGERIELVLPPTGSVRVELEDPSLPLTAHLSVARRKSSADASVPLRRGQARFPHVGLGLRLDGRLLGRAEAGPSAFAGPTRAGEEVVHRWPRLAGRRLLDVRLVLADGAAFADRVFAVTTRQLGMATTVLRQTDADGAAVLDGGLLGEPPPHVTVLALEEGDSPRPWPVEARVDASQISSDPAQARIDLGTLVLAPLPLLASGVVRDADGLPVHGAVVRLAFAEPAPSGSPAAAARADGTFELWGEAPADARGVFASAGLVGTSATIELGAAARGVELVLAPFGALQVALRLPPGLSDKAVSIDYEQEDGATIALDERSYPARDAADSSVWVGHQLPPGHGTLTVRSPDRELARVPVTIRSGETTDAGLLDVAAELRTIEIVVRDSGGAHLKEITVLDATTEPARTVAEYATSPFTVAAPSQPVRWTIVATGKRATTVDVAGEQRIEVVLAGALDVQFVLPPGFAGPGEVEGTFWLIGPADIHQLPLSPDNRWTVRVGVPGRHQVMFTAVRDGRPLGGKQFELELSAQQLDSGGPIELPIDLETWTAFLEEATPR